MIFAVSPYSGLTQTRFARMLPQSPARRPTRMATPMISHRLRAAVAGVPIVLVSALLATGPVFASDALRITTALAGTTVSGPLTVQGVAAGDRVVDVQLGLAPQVLGDCGAPLVSSSFAAAGDFIASIPTAGVPDGTYCLVAIADGGTRSAVVADIAVTNESNLTGELDGFQLPTLTPDNAAPSEITADVPVALDDMPLLGGAVLAITIALTAVLIGTGVRARQQKAD